MHPEAVERGFQQRSALLCFQLTAGTLQILDDVSVVGECEVPVRLGRVNLEPVVVAVEIRRGDFDMVSNLAEHCLVTEPAPVLVHQVGNFFDHTNRPLSMKGVSVIRQMP